MENHSLKRLIRLSDEYEAYTLKNRREIHKNPELSFQEFRTAALVCRELDALSIPWGKSPVEPGIIAQIDSGRPGKLLMLRADMDALPIQEENDLEFRSERENVMHACGHDVHTANLLTVARILNEMKDCFNGRVKLVFQPGEESGGGGRRMIEQGLLDEKPDACIGLHVFPWTQGKLVIGSGYLTAFSDGCTVKIHGKAAHSSTPEEGVDAIGIAAAIVTALNSVAARNISPMENSTLNVGKIAGGSAPNIIASECELSIMMRNITPDAREVMMEKINSISKGIAEAMGGSCEISFRQGYPSVYNDPEFTAFVTDTVENHREVLYDGIAEIPEHYLLTGSQARLIAEDFGFYSRQVPSCFIQVGTGVYAPAHSSRFMVDENCIKLCTRLMAAAALRFLSM